MNTLLFKRLFIVLLFYVILCVYVLFRGFLFDMSPLVMVSFSLDLCFFVVSLHRSCSFFDVFRILFFTPAQVWKYFVTFTNRGEAALLLALCGCSVSGPFCGFSFIDKHSCSHVSSPASKCKRKEKRHKLAGDGLGKNSSTAKECKRKEQRLASTEG